MHALHVLHCGSIDYIIRVKDEKKQLNPNKRVNAENSYRVNLTLLNLLLNSAFDEKPLSDHDIQYIH